MIKFNGLLILAIWLAFFCIGVSTVFAVMPTEIPPTCPTSNIGCYPPINVGSLTQTKAGGFGLLAGSLKLNPTKYIDFNVTGSASGLVGNKAISGDALDIVGAGANKVVIFLENLKTDNFAMSGGAPAVGKVMTSIDARGNAEWRKLFAQACPSGQALTGISADGSLVCATKYVSGQYYGRAIEDWNPSCMINADSGQDFCWFYYNIIGSGRSGGRSVCEAQGCFWVNPELSNCRDKIEPGFCTTGVAQPNAYCRIGFTKHLASTNSICSNPSSGGTCIKTYDCRKN